MPDPNPTATEAADWPARLRVVYRSVGRRGPAGRSARRRHGRHRHHHHRRRREEHDVKTKITITIEAGDVALIVTSERGSAVRALAAALAKVAEERDDKGLRAAADAVREIVPPLPPAVVA
jgi:hypothetical protein